MKEIYTHTAIDSVTGDLVLARKMDRNTWFVYHKSHHANFRSMTYKISERNFLRDFIEIAEIKKEN